MRKTKKGGQVTIFIILGVILLFLVLGMIYYFTQFRTPVQPSVSLSEDAQAFKAMRDSCLQKKFLEAKGIFGVDETDPLTPSKYEAYLKDGFPKCMNITKFQKMGIRVAVSDFSSTVKITADTITVDAQYPVTLTKGTAKESFSAFSYNWKREKQFVAAGTNAQGDIILKSPDQKMELRIPKGTTTKTGQSITDIDVKVLDRSFNDMTNPIMIGSTVYDFTDLEFSGPVTLTYKYESSEIPPNMDETQLKISYYDSISKVWVAWPSTVDTIRKTVTAQITHLSPDAVTYCTEDNNIPQIYESSLSGDAPQQCLNVQPPAHSKSYSIRIYDQSQGSCLPESGDNLRVTWNCLGNCKDVKLNNEVADGSNTFADVPVRFEFKAGTSNTLEFEVEYYDTLEPCKWKQVCDVNNNCHQEHDDSWNWWRANWNFDLTLFNGFGFFPSCITNNKDKGFDVTQSCVCGSTTLDLNSNTINNGGTITCCADNKAICGSSCSLKDCALGKPLDANSTGCWCSSLTYQPRFADGMNYCCKAGSDCSAAPCNAIMGDKAIETCYCGGDAAASCTSAGMICDKEHCCPTGKCWNEQSKTCAACGAIVANCTDGSQNQGEEGVDCGGPCPNSCGLPAHCTNHNKDADETGVDCGGADCDPCLPDHCKNQVKDGDETDTNCGGSCAKCANGKTCTIDSDCVSDYCDPATNKCAARQFDKPNIIDIVIEK